MDPLAHLPAPGRARVLVDGLDHPEGVAYDPDADVIWAGGESGQLYRVAGGAFEEAARAPGFVLGLAVDGLGRLAVCVSSDGSLCAYDGESVHRLVVETSASRTGPRSRPTARCTSATPAAGAPTTGGWCGSTRTGAPRRSRARCRTSRTAAR